MQKAEFWVATGLGLVMTAASLVFDAQWIALAAVPCFIIAATLAIRARRKPAPLEPKRTAGVRVAPGASLAKMHDVKIIGFDDAVSNEGAIGEISASQLEGRKDE